ncbi:MAG TPA: hypothetical protein DCX53_15935 [Anaerolineae bacterium]|nr:hypothetical protein [Anaerolineae bacterium]
MDFSSINWLAVVICVVFSMVSGFIWYNPKLFFPAWWAGIGKTGDGSMEAAGASTWILTIVAGFVQAIFMSLMVNAMGSMTGGVTLASGATAGFMLWLGFVAPTNLVNKLFAGHGLKVWAIEAGNHLVNFVAFGAIVGAMA